MERAQRRGIEGRKGGDRAKEKEKKKEEKKEAEWPGGIKYCTKRCGRSEKEKKKKRKIKMFCVCSSAGLFV